jgi:hypothetical protein
MQGHPVDVVVPLDHQPCPPDLGMTLDDRCDLCRIDEQALDLGGLIGAAEPATQAPVGTAARALSRQDRRQIAGREAVLGEDRLVRLGELGLRDLLTETLDRATPGARSEITTLLANPRIASSPTLTAATIGELSRAETVDLAAALRTTSIVTAPQAGTGLVRLDEAGVADNLATIERIAADPEWRNLDREVSVAPAAELSTIRERFTTAPAPTPGRISGGGRTPGPTS